MNAQMPERASVRVRGALLVVLLIALAAGPAMAAPAQPASPALPRPVVEACVVGPDVLCAAEGGCVLVILGLRVVCLLGA